MNHMEWDLIAVFLRVAQEGSFSAAAQKMGTSQPTVSRRVQKLEELVGEPLFARHARGFELTEAGQVLLSSADAVDVEVQTFLRRASGLQSEPRGAVRISASQPVAAYHLTAFLADFLPRFPAIEIEIVADDSPSDLMRREADVAVRLFQPRQLDLIARRVGTLKVGFYAHRSYLEARGTPKTREDLERHVMIGYDRSALGLSYFESFGFPREFFSVRTDSLVTQFEAILAGVGIGGAQESVMTRHKKIEAILPDVEVPKLPVWLVVHPDLRSGKAVRVVLDGLAEFFGRMG